MKLNSAILFFLLMSFCRAQVPADSLRGTYVGYYFSANPYTNPWTITQDTEYVVSVDTVNCYFYAFGCMDFSLGGVNMFTDYYSCNGPSPQNYYTKFYGLDSLRIINDTVPQPWPNLPYSQRFFGKRISSYVPTSINVFYLEEVKIFPNPASDKLYVITLPTKDENEIKILDPLGRELKRAIINSPKEELDLSDLPEGIYLIKINTNQSTLTKKVVIRR